METNETDLFDISAATNSEPEESDLFDPSVFDEANEGESTEQETKPEPEPVPESREYEVTYRGEKQTVKRTDAELVNDIQKSMDYDNVRKERDELKKNSGDIEEYRNIISMFAERNGMPFDEFFSEIRNEVSENGVIAEIEREYPGIPEAAAKELAKNKLAERAKSRAAEQEKAEAERLTQDIAALKAEYPDADMDKLPDDVQKMIGRGIKPVDAMRVHEAKELRSKNAELNNKIAALEKEKDNRQRAPKRMDNHGSDEGSNPFLKGLFG